MGDEKGHDVYVDLTSCAFDPKTYISRMYANASHDDLQQELLVSVDSEAEAAATALQQLLRDSVSTFVVSKETLDTMYNNDADLFTGDAVGSLANSFRKAVEDGEAIVAPTMELFQSLCACKVTRERLAKFITVWKVPGVIYEHCGARVPRRRSELQHDHQRLQDLQEDQMASSRATRFSKGQSFCETEDDTRDEVYSATGSAFPPAATASTRDDNSSVRCIDDDEKQARQRISRGALEDIAFDGGESSEYVLLDNEELENWYGTPLARRRDGDTSDGRSNFEAAVLNLRRAMVYLEENCNLEDAVMLGLEEGDENNTSGSTGLSEQQQRGSITITYRYALALLRAALYLNDRMALELQHVSATDTVLIEDMLSGMMDVSIAAVKLRHFCWVARGKLPSSAKHNEAILGLRQELQVIENESRCSDDEGKEDGNSDDDIPAEPALRNVNVNQGEEIWGTKCDGEEAVLLRVDGSGNTLPAISNNNSRGETKVEHPLEYYLRVIRNQHVRTMESTARRLCQEADEWMQKFMPTDSSENGAAGNCGDADFAASCARMCANPDMDFSSTLKRVASCDWLDSPLDMDGSICNLKDTATMFNSRNMLAALSEGTVSDRIKVGGFDVDMGESDAVQRAEAILEAFRTPERDFERFTTFSIGRVDMSNVLECSATQLRMYSAALLTQLEDRAGMEANVQAHTAAGAASTFADRLFTACVDQLEVILVSYWGGIAEEVHAGMFDFSPDPSSMLYRMLNGPALHEKVNVPMTRVRGGGGGGNSCEEELPSLRYVPVVHDKGPSLRELSVSAVRQVVRLTSDILQALLLTNVNRTVLQCFVRTMSSYRPRDLVGGDSNCEVDRDAYDSVEDEHAELHAALLVEVIVAQWEKAMLHVSGAVRRMKVVIGESCTSSLVQGGTQAHQVGELMQELEELRSNLFRCYTHGVGMLVKAYVTLLPSLQPSIAKASKPAEVNEASINEYNDIHSANGGKNAGAHSSVCARVSREFVSSVLTNKFLNLISFVVDRTAPFLQRFDEVHGGIDLFVEKAERLEGEGNYRRRRRKAQGEYNNPGDKSKVSGANKQRLDDTDQQLDATSTFMAESNSKLVLKHVAEHEDMLLALIADILLVFVDALHHKCQRVSLDVEAAPETCECAIMESLADALCLSMAVTPIITNELIVPCLLDVVVRLNSDPKTSRGSVLMIKQKTADFRKVHLALVEEHCQLLVDALLGMLASAPQQRITRVVQDAGFIHPMMDWQRVSPLTAGAVRPYVGRSFALIARAHEQIHWLRQPMLAAAITQRLVAHLAMVFVAATTPNGNVFEISLDCSTSFLTYGLLLIEAEGRTILNVTKAIIQSVTENPCAGSVLPELTSAYEVLQSTVAALAERGFAAYKSLEEAEALRSSQGPLLNTMQGSMLMSSQRAERCEAMVESALQNSRFIVEAMLTHVKESSQGGRYHAMAFAPLGSSVAEIVAERLAKRKEGYHRTKGPQKQKEKDVRFVGEKERSVEEAPHEAVAASAVKVSSRRKTSRILDDSKTSAADDPLEGTIRDQPITKRLSVLRYAVVQEERRAAETEATATQSKQTDSQSRQDDSLDRGHERSLSSVKARNSQKRRHVLSSSIADGDTFLPSAAATTPFGGGKTSTRAFKRSILH
ncbi:uncharacterized protein TEOVI_000358000 [Trypanosoma equiperdum]|uniref:Exocyst complex component EXOC2/Sec5 N-terminal domain-containing protein n=1 Tax=Trypanosoma equiperdum TaxID=5694 RepID=A0A1G4IHS4_TRYEQ|nr:hypothetical protein, conserved [Trypanosoma equiperdum]